MQSPSADRCGGLGFQIVAVAVAFVGSLDRRRGEGGERGDGRGIKR